jgi:hypothetical protein
MKKVRKSNDENEYTSYITECERLGVKNARRAVDQMIVLDFIIANTDRHYNNFGLIRDAKSLKWLGVAPIYDSGTSMWYSKIGIGIDARDAKIKCKSFKKFLATQIELVKDFSWLDLSKLDGIEQEFAKILQNTIKQQDDITKDRNDRLCIALRTRIEMLRKIVIL